MEREEIQLLIISFSIVLFTLLLTLFTLFYFFQKKKSKFLIDKMHDELLFHSELTKTRIEIKEQTLTTVSKELHDNIGQILSVALMQMNILLEDEKLYTTENMINLKFLVNKSLNEIRMLSKLMHSHSETIDIDIAFNIKNCRITIADSGKGFDCEKDSKGNGLNNIATRAELIGAAFDIRSELGKGSQITIDYPIKMAPESL